MNTLLASAPAAPATCKTIPDQQIAFLLITGLSSGMTIITCGFILITQGSSINLMRDRDRQRFLALVSLLTAIFGIIGNGLQESVHGKSAGDSVASFFFNWLIQVGFAGIAHNSIIRLLTSMAKVPARETLRMVSRVCLIFYPLTLAVVAPTFISLITPSRADAVKPVARDLNIALVCAVELLATTADIMLLRRFTMFKENGHVTRRRMVKDMWLVYMVIWLSIAVDIFAKVFRNKTNDLIPDLAVTNLTLTLRAIAALMYGTTVRNTQEIYSQHSSVTPYGQPYALHSKERSTASDNNNRYANNIVLAPLSNHSTRKPFDASHITMTTETHVDRSETPKAYEAESETV